jgi:hypothetical protein
MLILDEGADVEDSEDSKGFDCDCCIVGYRSGGGGDVVVVLEYTQRRI